jgi:hypothetical protein
VIYLDNILIFLEDPAKYIKAVREIFEKLRENKFFVNLKKYNFGTIGITRRSTVHSIGFVIFVGIWFYRGEEE